MGDYWTHLKPEQTVKEITIIEDGYESIKTKHEYCYFCSDTETDLYGKYGTWNYFGYFHGICLNCYKRIGKLIEKSKKEGKTND